MNPMRVLETITDRTELFRVLLAFGNTVLDGSVRRHHVTNAGVDVANIVYPTDSISFATALGARFRERAVVEGDGTQHPMVLFLQYLLDIGPGNVGLNTHDVAVLERLIADTHLRATVLKIRRSVGMLEDELGKGIGTGVLIGRNLLLTCDHIFTKTGVRRARVRFDFNVGWDDFTVSPGVVADVILDDPVSHGGGPQPDYILLRIVDDGRRPSVQVLQGEINSGMIMRLIHYPHSQPAQVSEPGCVVRTGDDYLLHDIPTRVGSSGAPLFDSAWRLMALHRGNTPRVITGTSEAVPMHSIWPLIHTAGSLV